MPGAYSRFCSCFCVKSDEIKCIPVLSTAEMFLEAPCIYDTEYKVISEKQEGMITISNFVCFEKHQFIKVSTLKCVKKIILT